LSNPLCKVLAFLPKVLLRVEIQVPESFSIFDKVVIKKPSMSPTAMLTAQPSNKNHFMLVKIQEINRRGKCNELLMPGTIVSTSACVSNWIVAYTAPMVMKADSGYR